MQRVSIVLLSAWGLVACEATEEPECAVADELLVFEDADQDGFGARTIGYRCNLELGQSTNNVDCDDNDAFVFPGATEVCDNVDNNCNGATDENFAPADYFLDADGDQFGDPKGLLRTCDDPGADYVLNDLDCDDSSANVSPESTEVCGNYVDDDCNGTIDDTFERECGDNKDGDCDGLIDCDDADCADTPECRFECTDIVVATAAFLPQVILGSTTEVLPSGQSPSNDFEPPVSCVPSYRIGSSPDVVLQWTAPEDGRYTIDSTGSEFDTVISVFIGECDLSPDDCSNNGNGQFAVIRGLQLLQGDRIAIVVDGEENYGVLDRGDFVITIRRQGA